MAEADDIVELIRRYDEAVALSNQLKRQIDAQPCSVAGHRWKHVGGRNCGCEPEGHCSVPVHQCEVCGDHDYGENAEARQTISDCKRDRWEKPADG